MCDGIIDYGKINPELSILTTELLNAEPLAQTWIRRECLYSSGHNSLTSPKPIQTSRARAGLNLKPMEIYE